MWWQSIRRWISLTGRRRIERERKTEWGGGGGGGREASRRVKSAGERSSAAAAVACSLGLVGGLTLQWLTAPSKLCCTRCCNTAGRRRGRRYEKIMKLFFLPFPKLWSEPQGVEPIKPVWRRAFTLDTSQGQTKRQTTKSCCACGTLSSEAAAFAAETHSLNFLLEDLRLPLQSNRLSWQHQSVAGCFFCVCFF